MAAAAVVLEVGGAVIDGFLQLAACSLDGCGGGCDMYLRAGGDRLLMLDARQHLPAKRYQLSTHQNSNPEQIINTA